MSTEAGGGGLLGVVPAARAISRGTLGSLENTGVVVLVVMALEHAEALDRTPMAQTMSYAAVALIRRNSDANSEADR